MDLKDKIVKLLDDKQVSYAQLAEHLTLSEKELDHALETRTLEVRTLELISKELRIPLYSFFRDPDELQKYMDRNLEPYYNVNIWSDQEIRYKNEIHLLKDKIEDLKAELSKRESLIGALEGQLKSGK